MEYVAWLAEGNRPHDDGTPQRAWWEASAKNGNPDAIAKLAGPPFPDALGYLYGWFCELSSTRSVTMGGVGPITHEAVRAWRENTDSHPGPHDVAAVMRLDVVWRNGMSGEPSASSSGTSAPAVSRDRPWPTKKPQEPQPIEVS